MPAPSDIVKELHEHFAKKLAVEKERVALKLMRKGIDPKNVSIMQRIWYDDDTREIHYELIPMIEGEFYQLSKDKKS